MPASQTTIGLLTTGLEHQYQTSILRGAIATAQEQNVNLVVYCGGELDSPVKDRINGNVIYDLATDPSIDAVILFTGTILGFVNVQRQLEFCAQYPVPMVSIGIDLPNANSVMLDNEAGMREAVRHLIEVHGYRHIAFIQGPEGNQEAAERLQAYIEILEAYGLSYDPQLVVPGAFQTEDGARAIHTLLDERKLKIEAIVAANDNMAMGALNELRKRSIAVPEQIAVVGFDDIEDAEALIPSLTTIRQPLFEQGRCGVEVALALLRNETVVNPLTLNPELVVRRSCGCFTVAMVDAHTEDGVADRDSVQQMLVKAKTDIIAGMLSVMSNTQYFHWIEKLLDTFLEDLFSEIDSKPMPRFISALDSITRELLSDPSQIHSWHTILTAMRREMAPILSRNIVLYTHAENLWQQGRVLISESIRHADANKQLQAKIQTQALNAIGEPLLTVTNVADLTDVMADGLPTLGVKSCYIALYEDSSREWSRLIFSYDQDHPQSAATNTDNKPRYLSKVLISEIFSSRDRRYTLLVEALHFGNTKYGFIVLEIESDPSYIYEALRKQISSALHTASILQQLEEKGSQLATTLEGLQTTQALLIHSEKMNALGQMVAGVAHEINNPIAFVSSNVHNLGETFEEMVSAYDHLEDYARTAPQRPEQDAATALAAIREKAELDFLVDDTKDLITQTLIGLKRVKDIVTELRNFSRLDEAEFKLSNLRENIESTLMVASGELRNRITVEVDIDPALTLACAAAELNQVFLNIIVNAAQAIEGKGTISIAAHEMDKDVVIEFTDTGGGIPENVIGHIFDPFYTTKPVGIGTGLGLAISHKIIVDTHKGSINVESTPGVGTKFIIRLPKEIQK